jgi:hypothetical protein
MVIFLTIVIEKINGYIFAITIENFIVLWYDGAENEMVDAMVWKFSHFYATYRRGQD